MTFDLPGRPYATKNSRQLANGRSFPNPKAKAWLKEAKWELKRQWGKEPSDKCYSLSVVAYYSDRRNWHDLDNLLNSVMDALKGVVVVDDKTKYIGKVDRLESFLSRTGKSHVEITLEEI